MHHIAGLRRAGVVGDFTSRFVLRTSPPNLGETGVLSVTIMS